MPIARTLLTNSASSFVPHHKSPICVEICDKTLRCGLKTALHNLGKNISFEAFSGESDPLIAPY